VGVGSVGAWLVHLYTASGAVLAFLATLAIIEHDYRTAFFWLSMQIAVDATDGLLARRVNVAGRLPWFSGAKLDDIVDYLTYVFVPALFVWRSLIVPDAWAIPIASAMLLSSLYGFNRTDAKTADHFFTGFPSYWNIVVFYLLLAGWPGWVNAAILAGLAVMVFVPIRYLYPTRTPVFRGPTIALGIVWGALMLVMLWQYPAVSRTLFWVSLAYPAYYVALSIAIMRQRSRATKGTKATKTEG
jgi:phosphatidylcholine synthase